MKMSAEDHLAHYGILRRSGRYPWGSGGNEETRSRTFFQYVNGLRDEGMSEVDIAKGVGMTTSQLRDAKTIAKNSLRQAEISRIRKYRDHGESPTAIGRKMGMPEATVRARIKEYESEKENTLINTANMLRDQVEKKGAIDIGSGNEHAIGISETKMRSAVAILRDEGYKVHKVKFPQPFGNKQTTTRVLARPDQAWSDLVRHPEKIKLITEYTPDGGETFIGLRAPTPISSKRLAIRYAEDGGDEADGVMYIRPGAKDLDLGNATYAQVRIAVDNTHYIKGMAMYKNDLPPGVDILFNTNKKSTGNKLDALKEMNLLEDGSVDVENPFGAVIKPGGQRGAFNIVYEEGDWDRWSRTLSSQTLSKQSPKLAKTQLAKARDRRIEEFDEIMSLTNPVVKRKLLLSFGDATDSSSEYMKAAAIPKSSWHVLLPFQTMKESEVYAPNYNNGDVVALVRYPHGGTFEIPELVVNNNHPAAKRAIGRAKDAVGINAEVAKRLSGADFDGDAVLVIPNNDKSIKTTAPLHQLKDFDPQKAYPGYEGMPKMSDKTKGREMGRVSNLITDMTIKGAGPDDIARAVKHSMVVIDAQKHDLNYKLSEKELGIPALMQKYQEKPTGGASTLISRARGRAYVPEYKERPAEDGGPINPRTGEREFVPTGRTKSVRVVDKKTGAITWKEEPRQTRSIQIRETKDARSLISTENTLIENIYADHSNALKALANRARKEAVNLPPFKYNPDAAKAYASEVNSLNAKLVVAKTNRPRERQAVILTNAEVAAKKRAKDLSPEEEKKVRSMALLRNRAKMGAKKEQIDITPDEWKAIQAGAVSSSKLSQIIDNADLEQVKKYATPKTAVLMTPAKMQRAAALLRSGATQAEVASQLGVSLSTLKRSMSEG